MNVARMLVLSAGACAIVAAKPVAVPLEPSSKWVLNYEATRCSLSREFGVGAKAVKLAFEMTQPRGSFSIMVVGPGLQAIEGNRDNKLAFLPLDDVIVEYGLSGRATGTKQPAIYWTHPFGRGRWGLISDAEARRIAEALPPGEGPGRYIPGFKPRALQWAEQDWKLDPLAVRDARDAEFDARAARVETVVVNPRTARSISMRTGSLSAALRALDKCVTDSLKDWGVDPAVDATIATIAHPIDDPSKLFTAADYPRAALNAGKESSLDVWLNITETGAVGSCRVISAFSTPEINDKMCKLVQTRQKFSPARTAAGVAVPSYYVESFRFMLER